MTASSEIERLRALIARPWTQLFRAKDGVIAADFVRINTALQGERNEYRVRLDGGRHVVERRSLQ